MSELSVTVSAAFVHEQGHEAGKFSRVSSRDQSALNEVSMQKADHSNRYTRNSPMNRVSILFFRNPNNLLV